jgi:hypothetical protein
MMVEVETLVMKPPPLSLLAIPLDLCLQLHLMAYSDQRGRRFDSFFAPCTTHGSQHTINSQWMHLSHTLVLSTPLIANGGNNTRIKLSNALVQSVPLIANGGSNTRIHHSTTLLDSGMMHIFSSKFPNPPIINLC